VLLDLRDHDSPCQHGSYTNCDGNPWCPGGAQITPNLEAVRDKLLNIDVAIYLKGRTWTAHNLINTALDTESRDK
jgi:hypothetical protein